MKRFILVLMLLLVAATAWAQDVPGGNINPDEVATGFVDAISSKNYGLIIGFGLMLLVYVLRLLWKSLDTKWLPWIAVIMGAALASGGALIAEPAEWVGALLAGVSAGLSAAGTWGLLKVARKP